MTPKKRNVLNASGAREQRTSRRLRRGVQRTRRRRLRPKRHRRQEIRAKIDGEHLDDHQRKRYREEDEDQERRQFGDVAGEHVARESTDVRLDRPSLFDSGDDRREVVIGQHDVRSLLGHLGSTAAHGDADISCPECRGVVDAVAGDYDDIARPAEQVR